MPLDPQAQAQLDALAALNIPDFATMTPQQARATFEGMRPDIEPTPVARVENRSVSLADGEVAVRIYSPENANGGALVFFHGGGWVFGDLESHDETCRVLAAGAGVTVIATDYRLAPETRFPGAAEDCYGVTCWVADNAAELGVDPGRIAIGGDSAGGNLSAVVAQMARDRRGPEICFQLLIYPVTDADFDTGSYLDNAEGYFLTRAGMMWFWDHYVPDPQDRANPYCAPIRAADLSGLPPAFVLSAEFDPLRDEGEAYGRALAAAGVSVSAQRYDGMLHGFFATPGMTVAETAQRDAVAALGEATAAR